MPKNTTTPIGIICTQPGTRLLHNGRKDEEDSSCRLLSASVCAKRSSSSSHWRAVVMIGIVVVATLTTGTSALSSSSYPSSSSTARNGDGSSSSYRLNKARRLLEELTAQKTNPTATKMSSSFVVANANPKYSNNTVMSSSVTFSPPTFSAERKVQPTPGSKYQYQQPQHYQQQQQVTALSPPFPDGLCGGRLVTIEVDELLSFAAQSFAFLNSNNRWNWNWMLLRPRPVVVWLPPGYNNNNNNNDNTIQRTVLYCHDGQNAMQDETSWTGHSWRLAGALTRLHEHGSIDELPIVVLLPSADYADDVEQAQQQLAKEQQQTTAKPPTTTAAPTQPSTRRDSPQTPSSSSADNNNWFSSLVNALPAAPTLPSPPQLPSLSLFPIATRRHLEYGDATLPFSTAHADFVALVVKPLVDQKYATTTATTIRNVCMGASLGGQASLHLLLRYPHLFDGAACLSTAFGPGVLQQLTAAVTAKTSLSNKRLYLDMGGDARRPPEQQQQSRGGNPFSFFGNNNNNKKTVVSSSSSSSVSSAAAAAANKKEQDPTTVPWIDLLDHMTVKHWWNPGYFWLDTYLQQGYEQACQILQSTSSSTTTSTTFDWVSHDFPGARHNERAWSKRIHVPLLHLLGRQQPQEEE